MRAIFQPLFLLLLILSAGSTIASDYNATLHADDPFEGNWTELCGPSSIMIPAIILTRSGASWTYPHELHPVYTPDQNITGTFFGANRLANQTVHINVADLNISDFLRAMNVVAGPVRINPDGDSFGLNVSGDVSFSIPGTPPGIRALYVIDNNSSTVLSAVPVLIAEREIMVEAPSVVGPGDLLFVKISVPNDPINGSINESDDVHFHYGAILIALEDYRKIKLTMTGNGTLEDASFFLGKGENSVEIPRNFKFSSDMLMDFVMILPPESAVTFQMGLHEQESELCMITEPDWAQGTYILTCAVISDSGIIGLKQTMIEMI